MATVKKKVQVRARKKGVNSAMCDPVARRPRKAAAKISDGIVAATAHQDRDQGTGATLRFSRPEPLQVFRVPQLAMPLIWYSDLAIMSL